MATLPQVPSGKELEDFVAALLQATGHFIEKSIEEPNVLELDIVASTYSHDTSSRYLFEVKDQEPRFTDIFKVSGWMNYLHLSKGVFVATRLPQDRPIALFEDRCSQMGIQLLVIADPAAAANHFAQAGFGRADPVPHTVWRFSFWIERLLIKFLREFNAENPNVIGPKIAYDYYRLVNNYVFLESDPIVRLTKLYEAYQDHPRLTAALARELGGEPFNPSRTTIAPLMREALLQGRYPVLHACMYIEHRARLSIIKAAVDYLLMYGLPIQQPAVGLRRIDFRTVGLPASFLQALTWLHGQPGFTRYPFLWQEFLWAWGGILVKDRLEDDLQQLSIRTGVNAENLDLALETFDRFFPSEGGWLQEFPTSELRMMKLVPWPFQGLGGFHTLLRAGKTSYAEVAPSGQYTRSDLARRHNVAVALLEHRWDIDTQANQ